jgi:GNAT superfamily N-acetyltransferase
MDYLNMIWYRKALKDDIDDILMIQSTLYASEYVERREIFMSIIEKGTSIVIMLNEKIIGYITCHYCFKDTLHLLHQFCSCDDYTQRYLFINDMSILPEYQKKGIGSKIINKILQIFERLKIAGIQLMAVGKARRFWEAVGFKISPELQNKVTDDVRQNYGGEVYFMKMDFIN